MSKHMEELAARLDQLERNLAEASRQVERLRWERSSAMAGMTLVVVLAVGWSVSTQDRPQPGRFAAPFEVVDGAGKAIFRVIATGAPAGAGVVVTGGDNGARHGLYVLNQTGARIVGIGQAESGYGSLQVRNAAGNNVFTVTDGAPTGAGVVVTGGEGGSRQGVYILNQSGSSVVSIGQVADGSGAVLLRDQNAATRLRLEGNGALSLADATGKGIFRVSDKVKPGEARVTIGSADTGGYAITVAGASGTTLAAIGEATIGGGVVSAHTAAGTIGAIVSGSGQIHVADSSGQTFATMVAEKGQGAFTVRTASGTTIARLGEGTGGGLLQLANHGGNAMVEAGIHTSGVGLVRAFPIGSPGAGFVGMPGTFLLGRAGGK